ncbi:MAG: hypothetical protein WBL79_03485, partial [Bacillota bacterium]
VSLCPNLEHLRSRCDWKLARFVSNLRLDLGFLSGPRRLLGIRLNNQFLENLGKMTLQKSCSLAALRFGHVKGEGSGF